MTSTVQQALYGLLDTARGYSLTQVLGAPTIRRYRAFVSQHVGTEAGRRILEIGCGVGTSRPLFAGDYTGIDINPDYIEKASRNFGDGFYVMNAAQLQFPSGAFDDAVSIATTHHLSDQQLSAMVRQGASVASRLHIIDAILPLSPRSWFKRALFRMDRGRHVRTFDRLCDIVRQEACVEACEVVEGPLHDVGYIRASRINPA
jgi:SAM-dependent methyltransferase